MKTILITGPSGFIGRNLLQAINADKYQVVVLSKSNISAFKCARLKQYKLDLDTLNAAGIDHVDVVIHLGAFTPKTPDQIDNLLLSNQNITFTQQLVEALPNRPEKFIFTSTVDVYDSRLDLIDESSPTNPSGMYGWSKLYCEKFLEKWASENTISLSILRLGHVYGPGEEDYRKVIPNSIINLINNKSITIFGTGEERRSFIYVKDCCDLILKSINLNSNIGPINIVGKESTTIRCLIELLIKISGKDVIPEIMGTRGFNDKTFDPQKMKDYLGSPQTSLPIGLKAEFDYFNNRPK